MPGLSGPPPTPRKLRIVRGNPGKRALPTNEPAPLEVAPAKPARVARDAEASAKWDELVAVTTAPGARVLTVADGPQLELTALAWSEYIQACEEVSRVGLTYETETPSGSIMKRSHPATTVRSDASRRYQAGLDRFGLNPAYRTKVKTSDAGGGEGDRLDALRRGVKGKVDRG